MNDQTSDGVRLPSGHSGSSFLHALIRDAMAAYPHVFRDARVPDDPKAFRNAYGEALVRFESARAGAADRADVARYVAQRAHEQSSFVDPQDGGRERPLAEVMREPADALELERVAGQRTPGLRPRIPYRGSTIGDGDLPAFLEDRLAQRAMTRPAADALQRLFARARSNGGALDLSGRRFAVLGAAAELSPAPLLLEAGAEVLWIDIQPPPAELISRRDFAGTLVYPRHGANLLTQPCAIASTLDAFAEKQPLDVGLFAYAAGSSQEWRLTQAMDAIVRALQPDAVRSIGLYVSPTSTGEVDPEDEQEAQRRRRDAKMWQAALARAGLLRPGHINGSNGTCMMRAVVGLQGASYQAAQYVTKILATESFAVHGLGNGNAEQRFPTVSANVGGITRTESMRHPIFLAAFDGAPRFGVEIYDAATTRWINGLLLLHDLLCPEAPGAVSREFEQDAERARALRSQQNHGALYAMPYEVESAIRVAALFGLAQRPTRLVDLARS